MRTPMTDEAEIFGDLPPLPDSDQELMRLYEKAGRSVDELAYTPDFDALFDGYRNAGFPGDKSAVFRRLLVLRKAGLLPRLFRSSYAIE